jgi:hypothetical protein
MNGVYSPSLTSGVCEGEPEQNIKRPNKTSLEMPMLEQCAFIRCHYAALLGSLQAKRLSSDGEETILLSGSFGRASTC